MSDHPKFVFVCCQRGSEPALKQEIAAGDADLRFAFSRPGFVTFKIGDGPNGEVQNLPANFELKSVFARCHGFSVGSAKSPSADELVSKFWEKFADKPFKHLHVWQRDEGVPGERSFEPGRSVLAAEVGERILASKPVQQQSEEGSERRILLNQVAKPGDMVVDCVIVEPNEWWFGWHEASGSASRWPGGVPNIELPEYAVSRAYLKMEESLRWSRLPLQEGDQCVEIGSSPGGSCQALLDHKQIVTGIDPADMDEALLETPNFTHWKKRGADLKRGEYSKFKWLFADSNVAPKHTLDTIEHIVTNRQVSVRGMILTLKMSDLKLSAEIPAYLDRIRSWGYSYVIARQLAFNRSEICVLALKNKSVRRQLMKRKRKAKGDAAEQAPNSADTPATNTTAKQQDTNESP